jgi:signal transduction histidine kinase
MLDFAARRAPAPSQAALAIWSALRQRQRAIATRRSPLLSKWPIRNKFLFGIGLLLVIVATLSWSGFHGVYAYRSAVRSFRGRADELPLTNQISKHTSDLRVVVSKAVGQQGPATDSSIAPDPDSSEMSAQFADQFEQLRSTLAEYRQHIVTNDSEDERLKDSSEEIETLEQIESLVGQVVEASNRADWMAHPESLGFVHAQLGRLQELSWELPSFLHQRIHDFADEVRTQRRALIFVNWVTTISAALMLVLFIRLCYAWVFRPLQELVKGSRRVAAGEFGYRIALETHDEMSELADAMNDMTARFEAIRDDLDRQVRERTQQVVRSEQLASVGFLAAGVAHEINNPLASIALCAESLEGRMAEVLDGGAEPSPADQNVIRNYLRMIQTEAFRCKGITERLLDFSRTGDRTRSDADLRKLVQGVLDMVGHLYRQGDKRIELTPGEPLVASVDAQEIKQVVLNLVTNALDSLSPGGRLTVELRGVGNQAEMVFTDDGCGMTDEVLEHLFEPFFTRRRSGQGTGLGLAITYRIIADHGGHIAAHSDGPDKGSQFRVTLPLAVQHKESRYRYQAA